ncbi:YbjQ family protein [Shewanella sedimentimangrovi]|uniref:YbjQ family protein n=1 Tax=Shewanella sedimentimangrovi TaxID=2814293 RepID=A0ABX7R1Q4_9GAMM|nr:YbjQ family protein [Shewanella sedimentimangrovi]QSX37737.1 YbjQ family protein [Shewanella sedimentimangrovi]
MDQLINLGIFLSLVLIGYIFGRMAERRHFKSIREREANLADILTFSERKIPTDFDNCRGQLVSGAVVVSVDYFKMVSAGLRNLVGGRVSAYESLLERARREAQLRMKEEARSLGAGAIFNVRLETSAIGQGQNNQTRSVEVYAYGTALIVPTNG